MLPFGVEEYCDLHWTVVEEHSDFHQLWVEEDPGQVQGKTRIICWWFPFGIWAMVVLGSQLDFADFEMVCVEWLYQCDSG